MAEIYEKKLRAHTTKETIDRWEKEQNEKIDNLEINYELKNNLRDELNKGVAELKEGPPPLPPWAEGGEATKQ